MDGNGNQWQQDNGQRMEAIKQQIAAMKQNLERNGENLTLVLNVTYYYISYTSKVIQDV